ncbi:helix-turn-helix transcriptional regulator [Microbacterium sp.]|uniref:helix-turn-helix transcriptional regulator n=1 Tax=Microbacterium sp. TaxID=51671 RepID=UPI0039E2A6D4
MVWHEDLPSANISLIPVDLALVYWVIVQRGSAVHDSVFADYQALADSLPGGRRIGRMWVYAALHQLTVVGLIEVDPIAGRSHRGNKARSWRLTADTEPHQVHVPGGRWLSPAQVCEHVPGLTVRQLRGWREQHRGPRYAKAGRTIVYHERHVDEWLHSTTVSIEGPQG